MEPKPPSGYVVSLARLHERGFGVPTGRFIRALCFHYGVELHNFSPNAISQAAVFVAICEGYLGVEAHWDLWKHLFRGELYTKHVQQGPRRPIRAGGFTLHMQENRRDLYIPSTMTTNNHDWDRVWFYLRNDDGRLPAYTSSILMDKPDSWAYGVSPPERQAKLTVFTKALQRLADKWLTAAAIAANFHRQRVLPLMERRLPIYRLMPEASSEGSRMVAELLTHNVAAQRAKRTVSRFPTNSGFLRAIKIVSIIDGFVLPLSPLNLSHARRD
jgi:hypothetical protein